MIVYVGNELEGVWVREVAAKHKKEIAFVPSNLHIRAQVNEILSFSGCEWIIFDLNQYTDEGKILTDYIQRITKANNATPIIFTGARFHPKSQAVKLLYENGIKNFIFAWTQGEQKEELEQCLNGFMEATMDIFMQEEQEKEEKEEVNKQELDSRRICIGIAGSMHRMGTTTQAIQIVKFLSFHGKKACYIEMNDTDYVKNIKEWFDCDEADEWLGKVTFEHVDLFYKESMLPEVLEEDYDYFIYDYGAYDDPSFNRTSFLEKDIRIFVVGSTAGEMPASQSIIRSAFYKNIEYIFNLVPESERKEILEMMEEKAEHTYFSGYSPDPFVIQDVALYSKLLHLGEGKKKGKQKKYGFRKRRRKTADS